MMADEQTHSLPDDPKAIEQFARFFGYESRAAFADDLLRHLTIVQGHYAKLFEGDPAGTAKLPEMDYAAGPDDPRLIDHLTSLGF
jgi:glutamate-ammonia-ligase adenylyltransferase